MQPSPRVRPALEALCRRIIPAAYEHDPPISIVTHVEERIAALDPPLRRDVVGALHFFDHPVTGMLLSGRPRRFSTLPPAEQDALLREWEHSSLGLRRTVFQALRRLILSTYYALPRAHAAIGYLSPLPQRAPAFAWEGPLHTASEDGPVARVGGAAGEAAPKIALPESGKGPGQAPVNGFRPAAAPAAGTRLRADACVIGSGAGGAAVAARLVEAGYDVVILEEGGFFTSADFDDDEARLAPLLYADGAARTTDDLSLILLQGRCVGGGTTINWMMTLRPMPWVMLEWEREHGIELLGEALFTPALRAVEDDIHARPVPDDAHNPPNRLILDGAARLGWRTLEARINAAGCVRAGACGLGCPWGAKRSAGEVYLPRAVAAGARLYPHVRADAIELVEHAGPAPLKRVRAAVLDPVTRAPLHNITVEAPVVVSAAGAVGTPSLLERSGLGGGGVGRWLRLHPTTGVFGVYDRTMYGAAGIPQSAVCSEFLRGDDGYGFWIECPPLRPGLVAAALPGFGSAHRTTMVDFARSAGLIVLVRDGVDRRRSSGDVRVDRRGRTRIRYRLTPPDRRQLVRGVQATARLHLAMDAERAMTLHAGGAPIRSTADVDRLTTAAWGPNRIGIFSAHVNGTCRMGTDPSESGCTPDGERHGVPGLYVADGSLFPTAPGVNPQLAIMAMARLVADRIVARHPH